MKLQSIKKAFTLIELLVVITIIGILATGATTVYTSQIQKARDSTRLTDVNALKSWTEQYYQDAGEYPDKGGTFSWVTTYVPKLPEDPKTEQGSANSVFDYLYNVSADSNTINNQEFEISTHFEQSGNLTWKAAKDGWDDDNRLELWIGIDNTIPKPTVVVLAGWIAAAVSTMTCVTPVGVGIACSTTTPANPMVIRTQ